MVRVLVTDSEYGKAEAVFSSMSGLECLRAPEAEPAFASAIRETESRHVVVGLRTYSGALYEGLQPGGAIARFGVGHDGIDKAKATRAGLLCTNTPGVLNQAVAEHAMLLVAAAARKFTSLSGTMTAGLSEPATGQELHRKTLAIVGCGEIGRSVARIAALGYGMQVVGCSRPDAPPPSGLD